MTQTLLAKINSLIPLLDARGLAELITLLEAVLRRQARRAEKAA